MHESFMAYMWKRTICMTQFLPFTIWVLEMKLRLYQAWQQVNHLTDSEKHFLKYLAGLGMGLTAKCPPKMHGALGSRLSNTKQREKSKYLAHRKQNIPLRNYYAKLHKDL